EFTTDELIKNLNIYKGTFTRPKNTLIKKGLIGISKEKGINNTIIYQLTTKGKQFIKTYFNEHA
ncbi:unnamed protein product, partial [marine sediment metagenome]